MWTRADRRPSKPQPSGEAPAHLGLLLGYWGHTPTFPVWGTSTTTHMASVVWSRGLGPSLGIALAQRLAVAWLG